MSDIMNLAIVLLTGFVYASLQLSLSGLLLLYHANLGNNIRNKTRQLVSSYISGIGVMSFITIGFACFMIYTLFNGKTLPLYALSALIGALAALSLVMWLLYYRRGNTTELWLPKNIASFVSSRSKVSQSNTEAFSLGLITCFAELAISIIIFTIAANSILELSFTYQLPATLIFTLASIFPLIVLRFAVRSGQTVVDIQKWRVRNKNFLRIISGFAFLILAVYLLVFKVVS